MGTLEGAGREVGEARFDELWRSFAARVQAYGSRHVDSAAAQEVVAETFLVAWRRIDDVPADALPWLLVVARNVIYSQHRAATRARAVEHELARLESVAKSVDSAEVTAVERADVLRALAELTAVEREAVLLVSWDGLTPKDAAIVAGCSSTAFKVRLHRARRRLEGGSKGDIEAAFVSGPVTMAYTQRRVRT